MDLIPRHTVSLPAQAFIEALSLSLSPGSVTDDALPRFLPARLASSRLEHRQVHHLLISAPAAFIFD